ncbi:MAG: carbohydrate ABC transporter permease [Clostridiales bacterium]|nr:carbohydrate ABC transporter permease [Clostridiales bacterium]
MSRVGSLKRRKRTPPLLAAFFLLFSFCCLYPFWYTMALAFNDATDAMRGGIYFWPRVWSLASFETVFANPYLKNSFVITASRVAIMTVMVPLVCALYAYAIAHRPLVGRKFFSSILILPMYVGGGIIPFYFVLRMLRLYNTFLVFIIPYMFSSFNVLLFRSYFQDISPSLRESAIIDGAREGGVFFRIIFPVSVPVFTAVALFAAVGNWNEWMVGQLFVARSELYPLPTILLQILRSQNATLTGVNVKNIIENSTKRVTPESVRYAMIVIVTVPILMVYPFLQKYFIHGIMIGAVKE